MPRVTNPLFSVSAVGTVAEILTYRNSPRGAICRKWAKPTGSPSAKQIEVREFTGERMNHWPLISTEDQASWFLLALERNIEPINAYLQVNWERHLQGKASTDFYPPVDVPLVASVTVTAGDPTPNPDWTGEYYEEGMWSEYPYYKRTSPSVVYLFYDGGGIDIWLFDSELSTGPGEDSFYGGETISGEYAAISDFSGILIASEVH